MKPQSSKASNNASPAKDYQTVRKDALRKADKELASLVRAIKESEYFEGSQIAAVALTKLANNPHCNQEDLAAIQASRRHSRLSILEAMKEAQESNSLKRTSLVRILALLTRSPSWYGESMEENLQLRQQLLGIAMKFDSPAFIVSQITRTGLSPSHMKMYAGKDLLNLSEEVAWLPSQSSNTEADPQPEREPPHETPPDPRVSIRRIQLALQDQEGQNFPIKLSGIQPAGPHTDIVYGFSSYGGYGTRFIALMKKPGELEPIFTIDNQHSFSSACFDGKYVWIGIIGRKSQILAIDPQQGSILTLTRDQGLPRLSRSPLCIGQEPGSALWAGIIDKSDGKQSCLAETLINDAGQIQFRQIYQKPIPATDRPHPLGRKESRQLVFSPSFVMPLREEDGTFQKVVLGRWSPRNFLFNLRTQHACELRSRISKSAEVTLHNGSLYWTSNAQLFQLTPDKVDEQVSLASVPEEGIVFFDHWDRPYVIGRKVWTAASLFERFELVEPVSIPWSRSHLHRPLGSSHYGNLIYTSDGDGWNLYQISFDDQVSSGE
ncbi:MAG: hypothetical protein RID07_07435 [Lacipirellulaceae bacterium]